MACKVFGSPVMDETVRKIHPNVPKITTKERAEAALQCMNADGIVEKVKKFIQELMAARVNAMPSTSGVLFNATGDDMTFNLAHNWNGQICKPYPKIIRNGECAVFLHVGARNRSKAAVVYSGTNFYETTCNWMLAWNSTVGDFQNNVYTEIREDGHYKTVDWDYIEKMMENQANFHCDSWNGCFSSMAVSKGSAPIKLGAIMTLDSLSPKFMAMARDVSKCLDLN